LISQRIRHTTLKTCDLILTQAHLGNIQQTSIVTLSWQKPYRPDSARLKPTEPAASSASGYGGINAQKRKAAQGGKRGTREHPCTTTWRRQDLENEKGRP
jgi:hypothetical protein